MARRTRRARRASTVTREAIRDTGARKTKAKKKTAAEEKPPPDKEND